MAFIDDLIDRSASGAARTEDFMILDSTVTPEELQKMFQKGIVKFQYMKKDGKTVRTAFGTKNMDLISKIPNGGDCPPKRAGYSIYFDMEKEDYRAYLDKNLLGVFGSPMTFDQYVKLK